MTERFLDEPPKVIEGEPLAHFVYRNWLRYNELQQGIIRLDESIRETTTSAILSEIEAIKRMQLPKATLIISSPGGGAYYALAIYDALIDLQKGGVELTARVEGWAASAAAMIVLQAAGKRQARANARFLLHEIKRWVFFAIERTSDLEDEVKEMQALTKQITAIVAKRCGKTIDEIKRLIRHKEVWMSASEGLQWGLIDEIV